MADPLSALAYHEQLVHEAIIEDFTKKDSLNNLYLAKIVGKGVNGLPGNGKNAQLINNVLTEENILLKKSAEKGTYRQTDYLTFFASFKQQQLEYKQQKLQAENDLLSLSCTLNCLDLNVSRPHILPKKLK